MPQPKAKMTAKEAKSAIEYEKNAALVTKWRKRIEKAKEHWAPVFKRMRDDQDWVYYGASKEWFEDGGYVVNILKRELRQSAVGLYARNPMVVAERREKLDTALWSGNMQELREALGIVEQAQTGLVSDPQVLARAMQVVAEVMAVRPQLALRDRFAKTLELLFEYFLHEQFPDFKRQMKATVYRAKINTVGYVRLDFQRKYGPRKEVGGELRDDAAMLAEQERRKQDGATSDREDPNAEARETELLDKKLAETPNVVLQEGPVFDFIRSDKVIPDDKTICIDGFIGSNWIAVEMDLSRDEIKRRWDFDVREHWSVDREYQYEEENDARTIMVWEVEDKVTKQSFIICEGCDAFIKEPQALRVQIERFWTVFPLVFGFHEHYEHAFPLSDAHDMRDSQNEYNVSREALADHRRQNKPKYVMRKGAMQDENTKRALRDHASGEIIEVQVSEAGAKVTDVFSPFTPYSIDMNQYQTGHVLDDMSLLGTKQEANFGLLSGATATESTIAENSRMTGQSSEVDDLDDFLSLLAKSTGQLMMRELSQETVVKLVGPGAVWPDQSDQEIAEGVTLTTKAGSAGRPNEAITIAKMERAMPFLSQIPGVNPEPLLRKYAEALNLPVEELVMEGLPSITAMNQAATAQAGAVPGLPTNSEPTAQGPQGADNAPATPAAPSQTGNIAPFPGDVGA